MLLQLNQTLTQPNKMLLQPSQTLPQVTKTCRKSISSKITRQETSVHWFSAWGLYWQQFPGHQGKIIIIIKIFIKCKMLYWEAILKLRYRQKHSTAAGCRAPPTSCSNHHTLAKPIPLHTHQHHTGNMQMCVCVCVRSPVYVRAYIRVCVCVCVHVCICVCVCVCVYACDCKLHVNLHYVWIYMRTLYACVCEPCTRVCVI